MKENAMFLYTVLAALSGVAAGILFTVFTKKRSNVKYGVIDKIGIGTNIGLAAVYTCLSPFYMFIGMISTAHQDGFMGLIGWIVSVIVASAALFAGLGIGLSVALRKMGMKVLSFIIQFSGVLAIVNTFLFYFTFVGTLISPLN